MENLVQIEIIHPAVLWHMPSKCSDFRAVPNFFRAEKKFVLLCAQMKRFLKILTDVRIAAAEVGGTVTLLFLIAFGMYKAWREFIAKLLK